MGPGPSWRGPGPDASWRAWVGPLFLIPAMSKKPRTIFRKLDGLLLLDKPQGLSSNQALQRVRHLFRAAKAGRTTRSTRWTP